MNTIVQDVKYALRTLSRAPGFAIVAIVTLALGIGANTAIFSLVHALILKPLPLREPSRLVAAWDNYPPQYSKIGVSPIEWDEWRKQTDLFEETGWYRFVPMDLNLTAAGSEAAAVHAGFVSSRFFALMGVAPAIGHSIDGESPDQALLSDKLWRTAFSADPAVIGRAVRLNNQEFIVAGVMPANFRIPDFADVWLPQGPLLQDELTNPVRHSLAFIARLRAGVTEQSAAARMETIAKRLVAEHPKTSSGWSATVSSLQDDLTSTRRAPLLMLSGAVALVLLIACANVANLMLARASGRAKEIAVRTALGAGAWRIVRQLLTESLVLSLAGGVLGVAIGRASLDALSPVKAPLDWQVLAFLLAVSIATGVLFGLAPALEAARDDPNSLIKSGVSAPRRTSLLRGALVAAEFALALMLVTGGAILLKSFVRLMHVDPGFTPQGLLTMRLFFPRSAKPADLYRRIEERVKQIPGAESFAATNALPLVAGRGASGRFDVPGSALIDRDTLPVAQLRTISSNYFSALRIPLISGRGFNDRDMVEGALPDAGPVIINQAFARRFWPGRDAVGEKLITNPWSAHPTRAIIVGVVGDVKQFGLDSEPTFDLYVPFLSPTSIVVRTAGDPRSLVSAVRRATQSVDADIAISDVRTMDEVLDQSAESRRWTMTLLASFAGLALALALVGIYGVMSWTVAQRTREIGLRMALGARASDVMANVLGYGLKLAAIGMIVGIAGAFALRQYLATLVFDVSTADPMIYLGAAAVMLMVALAACYVPARRATRVDPLVALRCE